MRNTADISKDRLAIDPFYDSTNDLVEAAFEKAQ